MTHPDIVSRVRCLKTTIAGMIRECATQRNSNMSGQIIGPSISVLQSIVAIAAFCLTVIRAAT
jgi:hypothetical protein